MNLKELRDRIDVLDEEILRLLNQRAETVLEVGRLKAETNASYYVPHREQMILDRLCAINTGSFPNVALKIIYGEIMSACRSLERTLSVAYLGPEASFTHLASIKQFGSSVVHKAKASVAEVFREVEAGRADYGVVAIENSTEGAVKATLDAFVKSSLVVSSEVLIQVSHYLLSNSPLEDIKEVHSHPQVLAQCKEWIAENLKHMGMVAAPSSAEAAKLAAKDNSLAAIGSKLAAELYGLDILAEKIKDVPGNMTRFLVIGRHHGEKTGNDKTSILFAVKHQAGALASALTMLAKHGLNLTNIQLRPSGTKALEYIFFVDLEGYIDDEPVRQALDELKKESLMVKTLGSYLKAEGDV